MGILYVVATPIGNLEDVTIRAIKTLLSVPVIACEDTRRTGQLIKLLREKYKFLIHLIDLKEKKFISVRDFNEAGRVSWLLSYLARGDVALASDAGTPLVSDPGYKIVRAARQAGFKVVPIPGPCAAVAALSASGLPTDKFMFWGFLPKVWELQPGVTHVIYENPFRLPKLLKTLKTKYPAAEVVVARELTKIHEEVINITNLASISNTRGEATILVYYAG